MEQNLKAINEEHDILVYVNIHQYIVPTSNSIHNTQEIGGDKESNHITTVSHICKTRKRNAITWNSKLWTKKRSNKNHFQSQAKVEMEYNTWYM